MYARSLFIFRRDLRLIDNIGLNEALRSSDKVTPLFIFDPRQIGSSNKYRGEHLLTFMVRSLDELDEELKNRGGALHYCSGKAEDVVERLLREHPYDAVFFNGDYTPFSRKRDKALSDVCKSLGKKCHAFHDSLLFEPGAVTKPDGSPYTVYTPFAKRAKLRSPQRPVPLSREGNFLRLDCDLVVKEHPLDYLRSADASKLFRKGGRKEALSILRKTGEWGRYEDRRNVPSDEEGTTGMSPHLKFGTVSAREVYWRVSEEHTPEHGIVSELLWRDFFTHVAFHFPHVFGNSFRSEYDRIEWVNDQEDFQKWCKGRTGFPLVDAGMRQLNETGYMHNRVRMVVASFLIKDLHIDWRWGERYFAQQLLDYDPSVNNGNWQWAASSGCDAQPYFRIFNPWSQQKKFDPECEYIRRWIPELRSFSAKEIQNLEKSMSGLGDYPAAMLDHREAREKTEELYSVVKTKKAPSG